MGPSPSADGALAPAVATVLLDLADAAIEAGLLGGPPRRPEVEHPVLHHRAGTFVTLHVAGDLNGCVGTIEDHEPLVRSVPRLAQAAAFDDPRLPPLAWHHVEHLHVEVSVLSPRRRVSASTRSALLEELVPGEHGLVLGAGRRGAVFLPAVWEQLPDPTDFVTQLLRKAGLPADPWPEHLHAEVFTTHHAGRATRIEPSDASQRTRDAGW